MAGAIPQRSKGNPISHWDFSARTFRVVTMIHRFPHTSDGAARFRLQSLDLQCWQVNGRWRPAGRVPPVRGRAANRTATFLLMNRKLACASDFYKSALSCIFYIFSKTRPAGRHILNNIKNKASPKHPQPETHCASSRTGGYILARNPKIFKTH